MKAPNVDNGRMAKESAGWDRGVNSIRNPWALDANQFKWGINITVRGSIPQTRPGHRMALSLPKGNFQGGVIFPANKQCQAASQVTSTTEVTTTSPATIFNPQGVGVVADELLYVVFCVDGQFYYSPYPFVTPRNWDSYKLGGMVLDPNVGKVTIKLATREASVDSEGNVTVTPSYQLVIAQDGINPAVTWDGSDTTGAQAPNIPVGTWMTYSGTRLWVASGNIVMASDLADPLTWNERVTGDTAGDFRFPRSVVSMSDYVGGGGDTRLFVWTDRATYTLQSGILDRTTWGSTPNFQTTAFPTVGCIAPDSIAFQAGLLWWYSQGGLVSVDVASSAYLSSAVIFKDAEMARVKQYMPEDCSGICATSFENYLLYSVPYYEALNSQTMVLDYATEWGSNHLPAWCGVWNGTRPVNWAPVTINSNPRLFHFSVDYAPTSDGSYNHLWESFRPERYDTYLTFLNDGTSLDQVSRIYSQLESPLLGDGLALKTFSYASVETCQLGAPTDVRVSYRGSRGMYHDVLDTYLAGITHPFQYVNSPQAATIAAMEPLHTQYRRLTTQTAQKEADGGCESCAISIIDKAYSLLVEWTGELGLEALTIFMDPYAERSQGLVSTPESTACIVGQDGASISVPLIPSPYVKN